MSAVKMDPELKAELVAALRSGKYKQGQHTLKDPEKSDTFCCLGVLCDILDPEGWSDNPTSEHYLWTGAHYRWRGALSGGGGGQGRLVGWLPPEAMTLSGAPDMQGWPVDYEGCRLNLSDLNDAGVPFSEIADLIEEQL